MSPFEVRRCEVTKFEVIRQAMPSGVADLKLTEEIPINHCPLRNSSTG